MVFSPCYNLFLDYFSNSPFLFQNKNKKKIFRKNSKNSSSEKRMSKRPENSQKLVEKVQKY
jgi:hypothetical protein